MPTLTVTISDATLAYLQGRADRMESTVAVAASDRLDYAASREAVLARHKAKVAEAKREGEASGVTFRRYTPAVPAESFADPEQREADRATVRWAAHSPRQPTVRRATR